MSSLKHQQGLSALGWLVVITIFGFVLLSVSKLGPHYLEDRYVVEALKTLGAEPEFSRMSPAEIRENLTKIFRINNIRGKAVQSVKIIKNSNGAQVSIAYEERIPFIHNIDVVLTFDRLLDSNQIDNCCSRPKE